MVLDFHVEMVKSATSAVLKVKGEIDVYTCPAFNQSMKGAIDSESSPFLLDLEDVHYIDSTGLGAIAHSANQLSKTNQLLYVICTKPQVRKIFEVSGLTKKNIILVEEESAALRHFESKEA